jgi:hypothetical protein
MIFGKFLCIGAPSTGGSCLLCWPGVGAHFSLESCSGSLVNEGDPLFSGDLALFFGSGVKAQHQC